MLRFYFFRSVDILHDLLLNLYPFLSSYFCHCRGVGSVFFAVILFLMENLIENNLNPDQTPHYVVTMWVCTVCIWHFYGFPGKNGLMANAYCYLLKVSTVLKLRSHVLYM